jgi:hypothetical protein
MLYFFKKNFIFARTTIQLKVNSDKQTSGDSNTTLAIINFTNEIVSIGYSRC